MGIFWLKPPISGTLGNGSFLTPRPSFPDFGDFDPCRGRTLSQYQSMLQVWLLNWTTLIGRLSEHGGGETQCYILSYTFCSTKRRTSVCFAKMREATWCCTFVCLFFNFRGCRSMVPKRCCTTPRKRCPIFRTLFWNNTLGGGCNLLSESVLGNIFHCSFIQHWGLSLILQFLVLSKRGAVRFAQLVWGCRSMLQFDCKSVNSLHRN